MLSMAQGTFGDKVVIKLGRWAVVCALRGTIYCSVQEQVALMDPVSFWASNGLSL